ncbi:Trm112 family protein [Paeniglutamicibacter sp. NPDC091659]|uniref:Trm112 family protein n=1 Tax=Paeniglutamicibacter sp. NPDC091659 TaxID=3364389 RepID=UPI00381DBA81
MSNLSTELSSLLRCPLTGSRLEQSGAALVSTGTGENGERYSYPIVEGIPMLLAQAATTVPAGTGAGPAPAGE